MGLLDLRDQLATIRDFVACLTLACRGLQDENERMALRAVCTAVREKISEVDVAIGELIGGAEPSW